MLTLVTGATGLVGNNVVRLLLERGERVRVLTRAGSDPRPLAGLDVETTLGDVRDPVAVQIAVRGCERVIHAAAVVHIGWTKQALAHAVNAEGTRAVALAAREHQARMLHVSSVDALGLGSPSQPSDEDAPPFGGVLCPYVVSKRAAEQVVLDLVDQGLQATIVNPAFMLGPWDWKPSSGRMLLEVARGHALWAPLGSNNFCDVRDVAAGILAAAERGAVGRRYILGGERLCYWDAWRLFAEVTGGRRPVFAARWPHLAISGFCGDVWSWLRGKEGDVNSAATRIAAQSRNFSSARAQSELGYQPRPVREAALAAWEWFREHGYA